MPLRGRVQQIQGTSLEATVGPVPYPRHKQVGPQPGCVHVLDFLGHHISTTDVAPLWDNFQVILDFPTPTDCKALQRFLSMINFYCRFLQDIPQFLEPLTAAALAGIPKALTWLTTMSSSLSQPWSLPYSCPTCYLGRSSSWSQTPPITVQSALASPWLLQQKTLQIRGTLLCREGFLFLPCNN